MTGSLALALNSARTLVSESASFRSRVGAGTAAAALPKIFLDQVDSPNLGPGVTLEQVRPFALIGIDRHGYVQIGDGARITLGGTGGIFVLLSDNPRSPEDHQASFLDFADWISSVMDEISLIVGRTTGQHWPFNHIELNEVPYRHPRDVREGDDFWVATYLLSHHINSQGS